MSSTRSRSRSPVRNNSQEQYDLESDSEEFISDPPPSLDCRRFHIDKYPDSWTYKDIKQFIKDRTNSSIISDAIKYVNYSKNKQKYVESQSTVEFTDANICRQAYNQLKARQHEKCEGKIIIIRWERKKYNQDTGTKKSNSSSAVKTTRKQTFKPSRPQISLDTYGLSKAFLDNLGIKLPILNKIFVANLECKHVDEAKLREVFGSAGQIVDIFMIVKENKPKMAKIEFDHPLEAVQAISMFHGQELFGRTLAVQMDNSPILHSKPLPNGLSSIGPGLGPNGEAMKGIRYMAELQPLKEYVNTEIAKLKAFINPGDQSNMNISTINQDSSMNMMNQALHTMTPLNINTMNPFNQTSVPVVSQFAQSTQNLQMLQGLLQQNVGNDLTSTLAALQAQSMAPNMVGYGQTFGAAQTEVGNYNSQAQMSLSQLQTQQSTQSLDNGAANNSNFDNHSRNSDDMDKKMITTDMLIFNNLPSSVSLSALKSKMREVGDVKFVEITDAGKAIVRFHRPNDAERCLKLFDRSKVDGQIIQVRFF